MNQEGNSHATEIGISRMVKITHGHKDKLEKLLGNTLKTLQDYKQDFRRLIEKKDHEGLGVLIHTSTMTLYYIEAKRLDQLMRTTREHLLTNAKEEVLQDSFRATSSEFLAVMKAMEKIDLDQVLREHSKRTS